MVRSKKKKNAEHKTRVTTFCLFVLLFQQGVVLLFALLLFHKQWFVLLALLEQHHFLKQENTEQKHQTRKEDNYLFFWFTCFLVSRREGVVRSSFVSERVVLLVPRFVSKMVLFKKKHRAETHRFSQPGTTNITTI